MNEVIIPILRSISFFFDSLIYGLITPCYELLIHLANFDLVTGNEFISGLINRIYIFLGIFMLFKVSFSIIQYIVDPNAFTDKSKGFSKLVTNCLVAIVLLVSVPWIFQKAYEIQYEILSSNIIGNLIMGSQINGNEIRNDITDKNELSGASTMATDVQFLMFSAFFQVNGDVFGSCAATPILGSIAMAQESAKTCLEDLDTFMSSNDDIGGQSITLNDFFKRADGIDRRDFHSFGALATAKKDNQFIIDYIPIISAFAGGYVVLLLITFCVDVALRVLKLAFLQMIAPISIVSYIDPKETMSNSKLHSWIKEAVSTYASLFIRIATIFLVMTLISAIANTIFADTAENSGFLASETTNMFIYIFLVIGAFMFAKQVPQMIENLFGIKMSGQLSLNPLKSAAVTGALGGVTGAALGGFAAYNEGKAHGEKGLRSMASALGGAGSGLARGTWAGGKGASDGKWLKNSVRTAGDVAFAKESRREGGALGSLRATIAGAAGMPYQVDQYDKEIAIRQNVIDSAKTVKSTAEDYVTKHSSEYKLLSQQIDMARQRGKTFTHNGVTYRGNSAEDMKKAQDELNAMKSRKAQEFANTGIVDGDDKRSSTDFQEIQAHMAGLRAYTEEHKDISGITPITDYKSMKDVKDSATNANTALKQSKAYDDAKQRKEIRQRYAKNDWVNEQRK